jgi:hypothetical protein
MTGPNCAGTDVAHRQHHQGFQWLTFEVVEAEEIVAPEGALAGMRCAAGTTCRQLREAASEVGYGVSWPRMGATPTCGDLCARGGKQSSAPDPEIGLIGVCAPGESGTD